MKANILNQTIQETLELCLSKMSKKLNTNFDPEDKNSIRLLQQFRSTLNTLRTWIKHTSTAVNKTVQTAQKAAKKAGIHPNGNNKHDNKIDLLKNYPHNKEQQRLKTLMNRPSGLHYTPTTG